MKSLIKTIIILSVILDVQPGLCQVNLNKTAQSTMNFLLVGTSSRASALGEAYTSVGIGSESIFYNPAGLAVLNNRFDVNLNYTQWIADINYLSGGVSWNLDNYGVIGFHLLTVDYGVINGTSIVTDETLYPLGYKDDGPVSNVGAYSVGISYAKSISREFSIGGTIKFVGQNLGVSLLANGNKNNDAAKLVFDAGVLYETGFKGFAFGMAIRNFATDIKREEVEEQLPLIFSLGGSINLMEIIDVENSHDNSILFTTDFLHQNNYSERLNLGIEYKFLQMISLRGGYQTNRDLASWSGGIGFNTTVSDYSLELNYSYSRFEFFNSVSRVSFIFAF
jgi:hypothetical protein